MTRIKGAAIVVTTMLLLAGCTMIQKDWDRKANGKNPYLKSPFYARYLNSGNPLDKQIQAKLDALKQNPHSAPLHNELGLLLAQKGFPKDAELEYIRSTEADRKYYQAWYNLGLIREALGNRSGAERAFRTSLKFKPGQPNVLFEMGLIEEKKGNRGRAVAYYKKAFLINFDLLDVKVNPRILDSHLVSDSLLEMYPVAHDRRSIIQTPAVTAERRQEVRQEAASPEAPNGNVAALPPVTVPSVATPAPPPQSPIKAPSAGPAPPPMTLPLPAATGTQQPSDGSPARQHRRTPGQPAPTPPPPSALLPTVPQTSTAPAP